MAEDFDKRAEQVAQAMGLKGPTAPLPDIGGIVKEPAKLNKLEYEVFRQGKFVMVRITGALHHVMFPLRKAQARKMARQLAAAAEGMPDEEGS